VEATAVDAIMWLIIGLASAWLAYSVAVNERSSRALQGSAAIGVLLAIFGAVMIGLGQLYSVYLRSKLVDDISSENTMMFVGIVVIAGLVALALDLIGTIDIMGQIQKSMNTGRPNTGGPSGDD
jgi:drug/metabolite transporter (DMT)-like permease